ncbi:MAG: hypothetical protein U5R48_19140 [Gammaproteobacteria bacterium]|nr:hypothetical protein [Gammaproteobacteria bacterium]
MNARNRMLVLLALCAGLLPATALADTLAVTGARVHTLTEQGIVEDATVVVDDGRIIAVGRDRATSRPMPG